MPNLSLPPLLDRLRAAHTAHPRRLRAAFLGLLVVLLIATSAKYVAKVMKPGDTGQQTRSAFLRWRAMILDVFDGANVYVGKNEYPNPPVMAIILRPFAELPPVAGAMAWFYAKVLMAVLAAVWAFRLAGPHAPDGAKAAAILLALPAIAGDLTHNNVNIFILFLVAACLELYRRGRDVASGLVLGLAIACKVTPLLFLAYFVWKRAGRVVAGCAAGLVLWLAVVPGLAFGWDRNAELLTDWYRLMVERPLLKGEVTSEHPNQALPGFVYRLFTHSPSFVTYPDNIPTPAAYHNIADIGTRGAWWTVKIAMAVFALVVVMLCRTKERSGILFAAEASLVVMGMLLFSERTWKHHGTVLLLPFAVLACAAFSADFTSRTRKWLAGVMVAVGLLTVVPGMLRTRAADLALVYGTYTVAFLLLTFAVCWVLASRPNPSSPAGVEPP